MNIKPFFIGNLEITDIASNGDERQLHYIWIGEKDRFLAFIEKKKDLIRLKKMIERVLKAQGGGE